VAEATQPLETGVNQMTTPYQRYSTLFSTIYDQQNPVGHLGRGTHYSVFRCAEWLDVTRTPLTTAEIHDFAVIWDEDHDARIFAVIEQMYMEGLLAPVQFIGERKGFLTVIVAAKFYWWGGDESSIQRYKDAIERIAQNVQDDPWPSEVGMFDRHPGSDHQNDPKGIIAADDRKVMAYLSNIDNLWHIGTKPYVPSKLEESGSFPYAPWVSFERPLSLRPPK